MNVFHIKWFEWSVTRDKYLMNSNLLLQMPQIVIFWQFWSPVSKLLSALAPRFKEYYNKIIVKLHCECAHYPRWHPVGANISPWP